MSLYDAATYASLAKGNPNNPYDPTNYNYTKATANGDFGDPSSSSSSGSTPSQPANAQDSSSSLGDYLSLAKFIYGMYKSNQKGKFVNVPQTPQQQEIYNYAMDKLKNLPDTTSMVLPEAVYGAYQRPTLDFNKLKQNQVGYSNERLTPAQVQQIIAGGGGGGNSTAPTAGGGGPQGGGVGPKGGQQSPASGGGGGYSSSGMGLPTAGGPQYNPNAPGAGVSSGSGSNSGSSGMSGSSVMQLIEQGGQDALRSLTTPQGIAALAGLILGGGGAAVLTLLAVKFGSSVAKSIWNSITGHGGGGAGNGAGGATTGGIGPSSMGPNWATGGQTINGAPVSYYTAGGNLTPGQDAGGGGNAYGPNIDPSMLI